MSPIECSTETLVQDIFFELIHELLQFIDDPLRNRIWFSGSFSLNMQQVINRPISDLDICVTDSSFDSLVSILRSGSVPIIQNEIPLKDQSVRKFRIGYGSEKVCVFKHNTRPTNLPILNLHGEYINLYPVQEIIQYKIVYLSTMNSTRRTIQIDTLKKHMSDVTESLRRNKFRITKNTEGSISKFIYEVNRYCTSNSIGMEYKLVPLGNHRFDIICVDF